MKKVAVVFAVIAALAIIGPLIYLLGFFAYGASLARIARCEFCHSPREAQARESIPGREFAGGVEFVLGAIYDFLRTLPAKPTGGTPRGS